jgi:hypothetical protein
VYGGGGGLCVVYSDPYYIDLRVHGGEVEEESAYEKCDLVPKRGGGGGYEDMTAYMTLKIKTAPTPWLRRNTMGVRVCV